MKLDLVKGSIKYARDELYHIRATLKKAIDLLHSKGDDLQNILLKYNRIAMDESPL
jgi:RNA polymerase sigma-70 factor (ECF subfamily)